LINKLQNGAISLILKIKKSEDRNIRFVGNLILNTHINFLDEKTIKTNKLNEPMLRV